MMKILSAKREILFLLFITILMLYLYGDINYRAEPYKNLDLRYYLQMARVSPEVANSIPRPFCFRLLGPYIAGLLPIDEALAFRILTYLSLLVLVFVFYWFLVASGLSSRVSTIVVAFFVMNKQLFGFLSWDYFQLNDVISLILILVSIWAIVRRNLLLLALSLILGALTREVNMVIVAVAIFYAFERKFNWHELLKVVFATIPGIVTFILVRTFVHPSGGPELLEVFYIYRGKIFSVEVVLRVLGNAFLPFSLLPIIFYRETLRFFRERLFLAIYFFLVFSTIMFAFNNERLMTPAFVVFYLLIACILEWTKLINRLSGILFFLLAFTASFHHIFARFPVERNVSVAMGITSTIAISVIAIIYKVRALDSRSCPVG